MHHFCQNPYSWVMLGKIDDCKIVLQFFALSSNINILVWCQNNVLCEVLDIVKNDIRNSLSSM